MIVLYVDDLLIACNNSTRLSEIKGKLGTDFRMIGLKENRHCLGFVVSYLLAVPVAETLH